MAFSDHVKVLFGADTKGFQDALGKAEKKTKKFGQGFSKFFVGALGTTAIIKTTKDVINFGASIGDMSTRLGASSDFLQALQYGAEQSGVKAQSASIAFQRFTRRTAEAGEKAGPLRDTLDKLGISLTDTNGTAKSSEQLFKEFGKRLTEMENPAEKVRVAFQFLDTEGVALTQMFQEGAKTMDDFQAEAERLGLIMDQKTIKALQGADATMQQLGRQFKVAVANYLPDLIAKVKQLTPIIGQAFKAVKEWSGAIVSLTGAILAYKASSKILFAVGKFIPIFGGATKATAGLTKGIQALNVATRLNPFGILLAGATALTLGFKHLIDKQKEFEQQMAGRTAKKIEEMKVKTDNLKASNLQLAMAIKQAREALADFNKEQVTPPSLEEQVASYAKQNAQLVMNGVELVKNRDHLKRIVEASQRHLATYEEEGKSLKLIQTEKLNLADFTEQLNQAELAVLQNLQAQKDAQDGLAISAQQLADAEFARLNQMEGILDKKKSEQVELERTLERIEALKKGGEEELEIVKQKHALQDQIQKIYAQGNMTLEQATQLATNLQNAVAQEKALHEQIAVVQQGKVALKGQEADRKDVLDALNLEKQAFAQMRADAEAQIRILNLRANGQGDLANAIQQQMDLAKQVDQAMQQQNIAGGVAVNQVMRRVGLENKIKAQKIQQKVEEIKKNAVEMNALRDVRDAVDRKDAKRIRASRHIERIDKRIAKLQEQGGKRAQSEIDKLKQVRNRQMEFVLDDKTSDDLAQLEKERLDVVDNHNLQMQALQQKLQDIKDAEDDQRVKQDERVQEANKKIQAEGQKQRQENQLVIDAGKDAIEGVGDAVKKLADRELDIKVNAPDVNITVDTTAMATEISNLNTSITTLANNATTEPSTTSAQPIAVSPVDSVTTAIDNLAKIIATENTLKTINTTLSGKFVNQ